MLKKCKQGFSLVEVMIALGLMGAAALAMTRFMGNFTQAQQLTEEKFDEIEIMNEIKSIVAGAGDCQQTLGGRNAMNTAPGIITELRERVSRTPVVFIPRYLANLSGNGPGYGHKKLKIRSYSLTSNNLTGSPAADAVGFMNGSDSGTALLNVAFIRNGSKRSDRIIPVRLNIKTVSATNRTIVECQMSGTDNNQAEDICAAMTSMQWNNSTRKCEPTGNQAQEVCATMTTMQWNVITKKCEPKNSTCNNIWAGSGDTSKWQGTKAHSCPSGCTVNAVTLHQRHHSSGDWDSNDIQIRCCCPST